MFESCHFYLSFWWSLAPRFSFLLLPFKLFGLAFLPRLILQKCAAVNANSAPAVNYSFRPVAELCPPRSSEKYVIWSLAWALVGSGRARAEIHPPLITSVIVQASPHRWKGRRLSRWSSAARNECHVGERLYPTTAENLRWRLDAWSPPLCPQAARTTTIQVLDFVRFKSAPALSLSSSSPLWSWHWFISRKSWWQLCDV